MFVITKFLLILSYHVQIKENASTVLARADDEFQKSKKSNILNDATLIKISCLAFVEVG